MNDFTSVAIQDNPETGWAFDSLQVKQKAVDYARSFLQHLEESKDFFFVETGLMVIEIFFKDPKEAMLFKLRFVK